MTGAEYRIEFSIQRDRSSEDGFTEIGFGSSGAWSDIDAAVHAVSSQLQNGQWETEGDMPDPADMIAEIRVSQGL